MRYLCSCGHLQPLCRLYFCRYCSDLRCGQCVSHEVDSHYCPNCLENMPSAEARLKKNRCANCFDCPSCGHTLSTRATSMTVASQQVEGGDGQPSKVRNMVRTPGEIVLITRTIVGLRVKNITNIILHFSQQQKRCIT